VLDDIRGAIRPDEAHHPITRLISLENTHNRCGGVSLSANYTRAVGNLAKERGILLHLDGARIFNAAAAQGVPASILAAPVDSVTFCLSKGLCAPVGSVLCGSNAFIHQAHRIRKQLGGGMRQAGILAAAGIVALETMVDRLGEDHARARRLAEGLARIPGLELEPGTPFTNMIFVGLSEQVRLDTREIAKRMADHEVRVGVVGKRRFRLVLHYWIEDAGVEQTVQAFQAVLRVKKPACDVRVIILMLY
jgi:threonine aldolase